MAVGQEGEPGFSVFLTFVPSASPPVHAMNYDSAKRTPPTFLC